MICRQRGRIIMFSSPTGKQPLVHRTPYAHQQDGGNRPLPHAGGRGGRYNITVNAICPGGHPARDRELAQALAEYRGVPFDATTQTNYASGPRAANRVLAARWL